MWGGWVCVGWGGTGDLGGDRMRMLPNYKNNLREEMISEYSFRQKNCSGRIGKTLQPSVSTLRPFLGAVPGAGPSQKKFPLSAILTYKNEFVCGSIKEYSASVAKLSVHITLWAIRYVTKILKYTGHTAIGPTHMQTQRKKSKRQVLLDQFFPSHYQKSLKNALCVCVCVCAWACVYRYINYLKITFVQRKVDCGLYLAPLFTVVLLILTLTSLQF